MPTRPVRSRRPALLVLALIAPLAPLLWTGSSAQAATDSDISGTVTDLDGAPIAGAQVEFYVKDGSGYDDEFGVTTDEAGHYATPIFSTATVRIVFRAETYETRWWHDAASFDTATDLHPVPGGTPGIDASLGAPADLAGTVTGRDGAPAAGERVDALRQIGGRWIAVDFTHTYDDGRYRFDDMTPGTYRFDYAEYSSRYLPQFYGPAETVDAARSVVVGRHESVSGIDVVLPLASHLSGTVRGTDGRIASATVQVFGLVDGAWTDLGLDQDTDMDGNFDVGGLRAGTYRVGFRGLSTYAGQWWQGAKDLQHATDIVVGDAETASGIDAVLAFAPVSNTKAPVISGIAKVGRTLRVSPGSWKPGRVKLAYQWRADGKAVKGATTSTLRLVKAQVGHRITVQVTAQAPRHEPGIVATKPTAKVAR